MKYKIEIKLDNKEIVTLTDVVPNDQDINTRLKILLDYGITYETPTGYLSYPPHRINEIVTTKI